MNFTKVRYSSPFVQFESIGQIEFVETDGADPPESVRIGRKDQFTLGH